MRKVEVVYLNESPALLLSRLGLRNHDEGVERSIGNLECPIQIQHTYLRIPC